MTPIVLVPGLLCTAEIFALQAIALWPHGPVTISSTLDNASIVDMATAILDSAPPRFALAGLAMGGYVAFEIMRQAPGRVTKLALISTSARPDTEKQTAQRRALLAQLRGGDFAAQIAPLLDGFTHASLRGDPVLREIELRMTRTIGYDAFAGQTEAIIARPDSLPDLVSIDVPTLILVGDSDPVTPPDCSREMAAAIPGARLVVVPDCGHAATIERADAVNAALVEWITA